MGERVRYWSSGPRRCSHRTIWDQYTWDLEKERKRNTVHDDGHIMIYIYIYNYIYIYLCMIYVHVFTTNKVYIYIIDVILCLLNCFGIP